MVDYEVIVVGAGPAGSSTALQLTNLQPAMADRILVIDKAIFPRNKLCGGAISTEADRYLKELGIQPNVPSFPINEVEYRFPSRSFVARHENICRIIQREEFDAALLDEVAQRQVGVRQGEAVQRLAIHDDWVDVTTRRATYRAKIVVAADGANSTIRRLCGLATGEHLSRLVEILTPPTVREVFTFVSQRAIFDFSPVQHGIQGYYWDFPSLRHGKPTMNRGLFDSRVLSDRPLPNVKSVFGQSLSEREISLTDYTLCGHPERWFDPEARHSCDRVLFVGDAAGAEPLLGEGISSALGFGILAARAVLDSLAAGDHTFSNYDRRLAAAALGRRLRARRLEARRFYSRGAQWQDIVEFSY